MIRHHIVWYEATDGAVFTNEIGCLTYEINMMYEQSGVKLYDKDGIFLKELIDEWDDSTYNKIDKVVIDRSKKKENDELMISIFKNFGWDLLVKAIGGNGTEYRIDYDKVIQLKP